MEIPAKPFLPAPSFTAIIHAPHTGAQRYEALVHPLVSALDLADIVDDALPFGAESGDEQRHSSSNVRRVERCATERGRSRNQSAMRIAENNLRAHHDQ